MKVILYGLTPITDLVRKALKQECKIIAYMDSYACINSYYNTPFYNVNSICDLEFDYIILCIKLASIAENIKKDLLERGISSKKIINFMELYTEQKVDKILKRSKDKIDGIILGCSYALYGIRPDCLMGNWLNLAVTSEDIYYHHQCIDILMRRYIDKIENTKYILIDLYTPIVLNWDLSLSSQAINYYGNGGIIENLHNYTNNIIFSQDIVSELRKNNYFYSEGDVKNTKKLFNDEYVYRNLGKLNWDSSPIKTAYEDVPYIFQYSSSPILSYDNTYYINTYKKRYDDTVKENKNLLYKLVDKIGQINSYIKIIFILMPRSYIVENDDANTEAVQVWKKEFENHMKQLVKDAGSKYKNMQNIESLSHQKRFWHDPHHLNYYGAVAFSSGLNNILFD